MRNPKVLPEARGQGHTPRLDGQPYNHSYTVEDAQKGGGGVSRRIGRRCGKEGSNTRSRGLFGSSYVSPLTVTV